MKMKLWNKPKRPSPLVRMVTRCTDSGMTHNDTHEIKLMLGTQHTKRALLLRACGHSTHRHQGSSVNPDLLLMTDQE